MKKDFKLTVIKYLKIFVILTFFLRCKEKEHQIITKKKSLKKSEKYIFGERYTLKGDFNGDGDQEILYEHYFDLLTNKETCKYIKGSEDAERTSKISPFSFLISNNTKIDTLKIASGGQISGIYFIKNEGDLNGNKSDEISYVVQWADWSSLNTWHIVSLENNQWKELYSFPIWEWQIENFENENNSLIKKISKNKIEVKFRNKEAEEETKIIELKN